MPAVISKTSHARWTILHGGLPQGALPAASLLAVNGRLKSLARIATAPDGELKLLAEVPPTRDQSALVDSARKEMNRIKSLMRRTSPAELTSFPTETLDEALAAAHDCGWSTEVRAGGKIVIPLACQHEEARFGTIAKNHSVFVRALSGFPREPACKEAALALALRATSRVRLARAALLAGDQLVWQVPMTSGLRADLLDHALNALATLQLTCGKELALLADSPSLASQWMREQKQPRN